MDELKNTGEILRNGYTVIVRNDNAVIAEKAGHAFATWQYSNLHGDTVNGHYFLYSDETQRDDALHDALNDFLNRMF